MIDFDKKMVSQLIWTYLSKNFPIVIFSSQPSPSFTCTKWSPVNELCYLRFVEFNMDRGKLDSARDILSSNSGSNPGLDQVVCYTGKWIFAPTPTLVGREELYTHIGFFLILFRQIWPIDIFIVESCQWYH